jgi:hypothetical protein
MMLDAGGESVSTPSGVVVVSPTPLGDDKEMRGEVETRAPSAGSRNASSTIRK